MTALVRLPNHVGDACMALPALHLLREAEVRVALVGRSWGGSLFEGLRLPYLAIEGRLLRDVGRVRAATRSIQDPPSGLVLPNSFGSALLFALAGVPSAGLATAHRGWLLRWPTAEPGECHEVERFFAAAAAALRAWGCATARLAPPPSLGLPLTESQRSAADALRRTGGVGARYALVAPVATGLHRGRAKHWAHFAQLVPLLQQRGLTVVAAPPPSELEAVRAALPGATVLPSVPLGVFAALADGAAVVIANDSGTSHVAAAVGARQVTIFGVTDRARTGPWSQRAVCVGANGAWPAVDEVVAAVDAALALP
ncbi:MAG: glycosyltransferase family 9 protein [Betaproteobacteria bacterium]